MRCKVKCPECGAAYRVNTDRLDNRGSMVRCQVCGHQWRLELEDLLLEPATADAGSALRGQGKKKSPVITCPHCGGNVRLEEESPHDAGKPIILLVDDKAFFRNYTKEILGDRYTYVTAASTVEALEKIDDCDPDLIILDLKLEKGPRDGHDILTRRTRKETPVLVLTGERNFNIHSEDWSELEKLGARDILEKGINIREPLIVKVRKLLGDA